MKSRVRNSRGSAISEFGPALFIFLAVVFFPVLDMMGLAASYGAGFYLNYTAANAVARVTQAEGDATLQQAKSSFVASGIGAFLGLKPNSIKFEPVYKDAQKTQPAGGGKPAIAATPAEVELTTTFTIKPFLTIPFFCSVKGLNAPIDFKYYTVVAREETE